MNYISNTRTIKYKKNKLIRPKYTEVIEAVVLIPIKARDNAAACNNSLLNNRKRRE